MDRFRAIINILNQQFQTSNLIELTIDSISIH